MTELVPARTSSTDTLQKLPLSESERMLVDRMYSEELRNQYIAGFLERLKRAMPTIRSYEFNPTEGDIAYLEQNLPDAKDIVDHLKGFCRHSAWDARSHGGTDYARTGVNFHRTLAPVIQRYVNYLTNPYGGELSGDVMLHIAGKNAPSGDLATLVRRMPNHSSFNLDRYFGASWLDRGMKWVDEKRGKEWRMNSAIQVEDFREKYLRSMRETLAAYFRRERQQIQRLVNEVRNSIYAICYTVKYEGGKEPRLAHLHEAKVRPALEKVELFYRNIDALRKVVSDLAMSATHTLSILKDMHAMYEEIGEIEKLDSTLDFGTLPDRDMNKTGDLSAALGYEPKRIVTLSELEECQRDAERLFHARLRTLYDGVHHAVPAPTTI